MALLRRWLLLWGLLACAASRLWAAGAAENRAFEAAYNALRGAAYERAENEFAQFVHTYTNSPHLPEAILYQAQARFYRANYAGALELLTANQNQTGKLGDEYLFWRGETLFRQKDYRAAADSFARVAVDFPGSTNRLKAALREADCRAKLSDWPRVLQLQTNTVFEAAARTNAAAEEVVRGYLLLGEAFLAQTNCAGAQTTLQPLERVPLPPTLDWERHHLLCRILLADGQVEAALQDSTNLLPLATAAAQPEREAESSVFHAGILERLGRFEEAITDYQKNLIGTAPPSAQRKALLKIAQLCLVRNRAEDAALMLERFLSQYPNAETADLALVTLGELRLRRVVTESGASLPLATNSPAATNLVQAMSALQGCLTNQHSSWLGRAELYLGWCFWMKTNLPASQSNFGAAARDLAPSPEQAMAYYKLADTQFKLAETQTNLADASLRQANLLGAISNYQAVTDKFKTIVTVETNLFEPALYQIVRAGLAAGDPGATAVSDALRRILTDYPNSFYAERAVLLTGQAMGAANPARARELFEQFLRVVPQSSLSAEVQLAIARTYEAEGQPALAIQQYDQWLLTFTNHPAQARAEYARALANWQAGFETNALAQFTNFIARFPNTEFAPLAQWWVADYYYRTGDSEGAEKNFQAIYQNTNTPPGLVYDAILMAGHAAFKRQGWKDARFYFSQLISITNCPPALVEKLTDTRAQAWFAYGDTLVTQTSTNKQADYSEALAAYDQVGALCPSNSIALLALGARANCFLQCSNFAKATNAYLKVIDADPALADVAVRSAAKVGLGVTYEKMAQQPGLDDKAKLEFLEAALKQYLDVYYHTDFLHADEKADLFWTEKAGLEAARLLTESPLKQRHSGSEALFLYQDLQKLVPSLRLEGRINALKAQQQVVSQQN
jgi:TolA-binding protein